MGGLIYFERDRHKNKEKNVWLVQCCLRPTMTSPENRFELQNPCNNQSQSNLSIVPLLSGQDDVMRICNDKQ